MGDNALAMLTLAPVLQLCPPQPCAALVLLFFKLPSVSRRGFVA